ncbi:zinc finger MYM-type protein 1-like [Zingiber officinale]|uniref:zinc finger MYM-type protein 1-like n=1 Tax=Zingiber officinale TaxID=94328 RepID=UPI001C4CF57A|nr:zinc finger MYM-type protein 1-like [Zingiber officinale]
MNCEALMNQDEHIQSILHKQSKQMRNDYRIRLNALIDCIRVLLRQGNSFRGHDETEGSLNLGNFLILLEFLGAHNKEINDVILKNAPKNCKLTSPDIQKDIVRVCASEIINVIIKDIGNSLFSVLVDESRDVSMKEQMSVVLRYVDSSGHVNERFIGIEHVTSTTSLSLKAAIDKMFSKYNLSIANVRGQGFDGASNMQGKFNGLKALILKENPCAFYIHCFAHQLQLAFIAVAKKNLSISNFFRIVGDVVNVVGSSCKRSDLLKEKHSNFIVEALERDEISSGRGLNQETTLQCAGDTRWGSHYNSLISLISMFSAVSDVLEVISEDDSSSPDQKTEAFNLLESILSFDFAFNLHLMKHVLGISSELSTTLQKKDQDIVNAMDLVQHRRCHPPVCRSLDPLPPDAIATGRSPLDAIVPDSGEIAVEFRRDRGRNLARSRLVASASSRKRVRNPAAIPPDSGRDRFRNLARSWPDSGRARNWTRSRQIPATIAPESDRDLTGIWRD